MRAREARHLEREQHPRPSRPGARMARSTPAGRPLHAGDEGRGRGLSRRCASRARLRDRLPRPAHLQRRRDPLAHSARRRDTRLRRRRRRCTGTNDLRDDGRHPRDVGLRPERRAGRLGQVPLQARLDGAPAPLGGRSHAGGVSRDPLRRLQRRARTTRRLRSGRVGRPRAVQRRRARGLAPDRRERARRHPAHAASDGADVHLVGLPDAGIPEGSRLWIDHLLATPALAARALVSGVDRESRKGKQPSDHAAVWVELGG